MAHHYFWQNLIHQVCCLVVHPPGTTARTKSPFLTRKGYNPRLPALVTIPPDKSKFSNSTTQIFIKFIFDKDRNVPADFFLLPQKQRPIGFNCPVKPNQVIESFNSRVRDECLNEHVFFSLEDAREKIDDWHWRYNNINPHSSLGMKAPLEFAKERRQEQEVVLAS